VGRSRLRPDLHAGQWRDVGRSTASRQARYGTLSLVSIVAVLGILVAVNYLASRKPAVGPDREPGLQPLGAELQGLDAPVQFTVYDQETGFDRFRNRFETYQYESNQVKVEYVDVDRQPARAKEAGITQYGTVVATYRDREQRLTTSIEEQDVTNALIKLVSGAEKKVYFTVGHGERETDSADRLRGYNAITAALGRDNFAVAPLPLIQQGQVPDDATVVVVAGPTTDFLAPEVEAMKRYVARGGKVLLLLDPPGAGADLNNLIGFLKEWSIELGNDVVVDASGIGQLFGGDASVPVVLNYPAHPITDNFRVMTAFPHARSVQAVPGGTHTPQPLLETSQQSWAETDLKAFAAGDVEFTEGADRRGPISVGVAVSAPAAEPPAPPLAGNLSPDAPQPESRIVVIGDSDFAGNNALGIQGNQDLFLNAVNWLAQQEDLIAIRPRDVQDRRITLTADDQQRVFLLSILVIPGLVFAAGVYSWWRRR
jgi:ABC-type uncharacterized transport system involved in gliding motility auxiliary subunit